MIGEALSINDAGHAKAERGRVVLKEDVSLFFKSRAV
jgi:hypothetical protein